MKRIQIALACLVFSARCTHAQMLPAMPGTALQAELPTLMRSVPSASPFYGSIEGLPPADPRAVELYRADPKLWVGADLGANFAIEATLLNPNYRPGLHLLDYGPRLAQGVPLAARGFDLDIALRKTVTIDDRLGAFGTLGVSASKRIIHQKTSSEVGPIASAGFTYKMDNGQTATFEVPFGTMARSVITGKPGKPSAQLKFGF